MTLIAVIMFGFWPFFQQIVMPVDVPPLTTAIPVELSGYPHRSDIQLTMRAACPPDAIPEFNNCGMPLSYFSVRTDGSGSFMGTVNIGSFPPGKYFMKAGFKETSFLIQGCPAGYTYNTATGVCTPPIL